MLNIGVLASGGGTNLQSLIDSINSGYIKGKISVVLSDRPMAYALERARENNIPSICYDRKVMTPLELNSCILNELLSRDIKLIVLAGYLSILSSDIISAYKDAIVNIHPSLIPSFCGPGYYGLKVHEKAIEYGVKISGCTVHFVDEGTDTGPIILQQAVEVKNGDTPLSLQQRILNYEHVLLPEAVKLICDGSVSIKGRKVIIREGQK